jgi:hypothetical protein
MNEQEVCQAYVMQTPVEAMMMGWQQGYIIGLQVLEGVLYAQIHTVGNDMEFSLKSPDFASRLRKETTHE